MKKTTLKSIVVISGVLFSLITNSQIQLGVELLQLTQMGVQNGD
jgi:hypothetical protein